MPYIVVDAGHGGWDNGAQFFGVREKDINLRVATKVTNRLRQIGFTVTQLRTDDTDIGNASARGRQIAQLSPDFAVSIHCNSSGGAGLLSGAELIVPLRKSVARFEYYTRSSLSRLNNFRMIYSRASGTGLIYERFINPDTIRFTTTYDINDYYGIIREAWNNGGVAVDLVEMFYLDNEADLYTFLNQEDQYVEAIVYGLSRAFNMNYDRGIDGHPSHFATTPKTYYRVVCGTYSNFEEAKAVQQRLSNEYAEVWVQPVETNSDKVST